MVLVAQCLGLRISEVMALQWSDFDFANLTVRVQRGIVHGRVDVVKTEYSNDDLPLDSNLCAILQHWKQQCPVSPNGWVFPNPTTLKPYWQESICADHIKPAAVKAGLRTNIGWHTFRHYAGRWTIPGKRRTDSPKPHYCGLWNFASTAARHSLGPRFLT